jgi:hypothetical protein
MIKTRGVRSMLNEGFNTVSTGDNSGLLLIYLFVISTLIFGIPAILKRSLKGVLLTVFVSIFATFVAYLIFF